MSGIKVLDSNLIDKIAAGEVVERPSAVVKELVENSIDAGSKNITIEIRDGGKTLIRISDDGKGISKRDVKTAFMRHATSKIESFDDLENVLSLGFRGEALSSICSVSKVTMITKTAEDETGTKIVLNGENLEEEAEIGATTGTTIIVCDLFFNTPARQKFLKKVAQESAYISDIINKYAIGHPEISFKYINNNSTLIQTKGNDDLKTAILQVYGKETMKNLIPIEYNKNGVKLSGFVGNPSISRGNRAYEHFFLNGRYIKSSIVSDACENAYKTLLMQGKFPFYVIKMDITPTLVDVNVHPTKLEVRFADEDLIFATLNEAVLKSLKSETVITSFRPTQPPEKPAETPTQRPDFQQQRPTFPQTKNVASSVYGKQNSNLAVREAVLSLAEMDDNAGAKKALPWEVAPKVSEEAKQEFKQNYKIVGQIFATYWLVEQGEKVFVIDQHAAHERIMYEEIKKKAERGTIASQTLLQPIVLKLTQSEILIFNDNKDIFDKFGFDVEKFGEDVYALRCVPYVVKGAPSADFFIEILDKLSTLGGTVTNISQAKDEVIASFACKAAVKANNALTYAEAKELIAQILEEENGETCPHGRPTVIEMTKYEFEKKFKRV